MRPQRSLPRAEEHLFLRRFRRDWTPTDLPRKRGVPFALREWQIGLERHRHTIPIFPRIPASPGLPTTLEAWASPVLPRHCLADYIYAVKLQPTAGRPGRRIFQQLRGVGEPCLLTGNLMAVLGTGLGAWIGRFTPIPQLNIQAQDFERSHFLAFVPSTNFVCSKMWISPRRIG